MKDIRKSPINVFTFFLLERFMQPKQTSLRPYQPKFNTEVRGMGKLFALI